MIQKINRELDTDRRAGRFRNLLDKLKQLAGAAISLGVGPQSYFCEALDALLERTEHPDKLGRSGLRTITQPTGFLSEAFDPGRRFNLVDYPPFKVLSLDDDSISHCGIQLALGKFKQKGVECSTAHEAIALSEQHAFDLILLDVELPESSSYEVCTQLRRGNNNQSVPVVFVTRHTDPQDRAQATMSGATDSISKPFNSWKLP